MKAIKERKIVYTSGQIAERVRAMAAEIDAVYGDEPLVAVCVLKGAVFFFTDLVRAMRSENLELDFVRLSSYGKGTSSSRHVVFSKDVDCDITGKHVLIVEDVVDSGLSMQFLMRQFEARGARSLRLAALVDKNERREVDVLVDFAGFKLEEGFIVGYASDYAEKYRPCLMWKRAGLRIHRGLAPARTWSQMMEIQCPHCASRFNLPEHLARPGAKLRCSVCKAVFALQLPEPAPAPIPDLLPDDVEQPRPRRRWLFWLMLLLLLACGGASVYWYCWHERPLTPVQGTAATAENIALLTMKDVRQYYVNNEKMGKILVIEGRVVNEFPQPVSMITVEAVLYGQNQKVIASNRQTAGNQLTPLQLSVLDKEAMASRLADPEKEQGANVTLLPGASAPFMVVFDSPPNDVSEFYVAIVDAQKGVPLPR